jgi:hypothetical protein
MEYLCDSGAPWPKSQKGNVDKKPLSAFAPQFSWSLETAPAPVLWLNVKRKAREKLTVAALADFAGNAMRMSVKAQFSFQAVESVSFQLHHREHFN